MKKIIPAREEITCDFCGNTNPFKCEAVLKIKRHGLDYCNMPVGDASSNFDACDKCIIDIEMMLIKFKKIS